MSTIINVTTSGIWTSPITGSATFDLISGGGGGSGAGNATTYFGAGGAGGNHVRKQLNVTAGDKYYMTVGTGGSSATSGTVLPTLAMMGRSTAIATSSGIVTCVAGGIGGIGGLSTFSLGKGGQNYRTITRYISSSILNGGAGYTTTPTVTVGTPWITNSFYNAGTQVVNGGKLYTVTVNLTSGASAPTHTTGTINNLSYAGNAGSAAITLNNNIITSIAITAPSGSNGYTSNPIIMFTGGGGIGAVATCSFNNPFTITNGGNNYTAATAVTVGTKWTANISYTSGTQVFNGDYLYTVTTTHAGTVAPTHTTGTANSNFSFAGTAATAKAIVTNGAVTDIILQNLGTGYMSAPTVSFSVGTGAVASCSLDTLRFGADSFNLGGDGADGVIAVAGGGGGGAYRADGGKAAGITGGAGITPGGAGGNGSTTASGSAAALYGGGGGGAANVGSSTAGAAGLIRITLPINTVTPVSTVTVNDVMTAFTHTTTGATGIGTPSGLPPDVTATWTNGTITISGQPTQGGTFNYSILLTGGVGTVSASGTIIVNFNSVSGASISPVIPINTVIANITHTTTGATGIGTVSGLPNGVTAVWQNNIITISGAPTQIGIFTYILQLTGGYTYQTIYATGTIIVTNAVTVASVSPKVFINTPIPLITHTTVGATGITNIQLLPPGVTAAWSNNTITINGTPTTAGTFNYTIQLTGGYGTVNATGTITVNPTSIPITTNQTWRSTITGAVTFELIGGGGGGSGANGAAGGGGAGGNYVTKTIPVTKDVDYVFSIGTGGSAAISGTSVQTYSMRGKDTIVTSGGATVLRVAGGMGAMGGNSTFTGAGGRNYDGANNALKYVSTYTVTNGGSYSTAPTVTVGQGWAANTIYTANTQVFNGSYLYTVTVNYTSGAVAPTHTTGTVNNLLYAGTAATAIATINGSAVTSITPVNIGTGYVSAPVVSFSTGSATATCGYDIISVQSTYLKGGNGASASSTTVAGGGGGAAYRSVGNAANGLTGGAGVGIGGAGSNAVSTGSATPGSTYGGGGGGASNVANSSAGAVGYALITILDNTVTAATGDTTVGLFSSVSITHTTTGATGIGTPAGLPNGVTATWADTTITISGSPTSTGTFDYSIPMTGGAGTVSATGTITVLSLPTIGALSVPFKVVNDQPFDLTAPSSDSTGAFTYRSSNASVATMNGVTVTILGAGTTTITAIQAADGNYGSGSVFAYLSVSPMAPTVVVTQPTSSVSTGSFTVTGAGTGVTYSLDGNDFTNATTFTGLLAKNHTIVAKVSDCISAITTVVIKDWPVIVFDTSTFTFNGQAQSPTASITSGIPTYEYFDSDDIPTSPPTNPGEYIIYATLAETGTSQSVSKSLRFSITVPPPTLVGSQSFIYDNGPVVESLAGLDDVVYEYIYQDQTSYGTIQPVPGRWVMRARYRVNGSLYSWSESSAFDLLVPTVTVSNIPVAIAGTASFFTVTGVNLTDNITISSTAVEFLTDNVWSSSSLTLYPSNNTVPLINIYVRATAAVGPWSGAVAIASRNAVTQTVNLSGVVSAPAPVIVVNHTLHDFATRVGQSSAVQSFTVAGFNLVNDITVTGFNGGQVSVSGAFSAHVTIPVSSLPATVSARLWGGVEGTGPVTFTCSSDPATQQAVSVNGIVTPATITVGSINVFRTTINQLSPTQEFTIASDGVDDIFLSAPAGCEVSVNNIVFSGYLQIAPAGGPVYARLLASTKEYYTGTITCTADNTNTVNIAISGAPAPSISVAGTLSAHVAVAGTASASQSFTVTARFAGQITISSIAAELSLDNVSFYTSLLSNQPETKIYVRIPATAVAGSWSGTVVIASPDTADKNVLLSGTVSATATTSGDPYVTTFQGLQYKLPNIVRSYRLLEYPISTGTLFINASISGLTKTEQQEIGDGLEKNGFFYDQFFIGTQDSFALLDRELNLVRCNNLHNYNVTVQDTPQPFHCPIQGSSMYIAKIIQIDDVTVELRLFSNPQIRNGIKVAVSEHRKASGLLNSAINPKHFSIRSVCSTKVLNLISEQKIYQREIKEYWMDTRDTKD